MSGIMSQPVLLSVRDLSVEFGGTRFLLRRREPLVQAVKSVSLDLHQGEILGLAGESGSGKSTLGRAILGIQPESAGSIIIGGKELSGQPVAQAREQRQMIQYVHQDPGAALDPWWTIGRSLVEGLTIHGISKSEAETRIRDVFDSVGLPASFLARYPHELSGGQLRRVGIGRVLVLRPKVVIFDEPTSGLDLSVQLMVLQLMLDLHRDHDLTYIFISHDLSVIRQICDRVAIMQRGEIVELEETERLFTNPQHPYTNELLSAIPHLEAVEA